MWGTFGAETDKVPGKPEGVGHPTKRKEDSVQMAWDNNWILEEAERPTWKGGWMLSRHQFLRH